MNEANERAASAVEDLYPILKGHRAETSGEQKIKDQVAGPDTSLGETGADIAEINAEFSVEWDPDTEQTVVDAVQARCYQVSANHGFHDTDDLRTAVFSVVDEDLLGRENGDEIIEQIVAGLSAKWTEMQHSKRLLLIVGELIEAMEEMRHGHAPNEVYQKDGKPEGVPIELADVQIRLWDLTETMGFSLQEQVQAKEAFNRTRERLHGRKY